MAWSTPDHSLPDPPLLSVIVPMFREARRIEATLRDAISTLENMDVTSEIILVDDGSTDDTIGVVTHWLSDHARGSLQRVALLRHPRNRGKGAAVVTGLAAARGGWRLMMDADNACRVREVHALRAEVTPSVGMVAGSRVAPRANVEARPHRRLSGWLFKRALGAMGLSLLGDTQCGFKLYRADVAEQIVSLAIEPGYAFDLEHLLIAGATGLRVVEVGVQWHHQDGGQVSPVRDGLKMLRAAARLRARWPSVRSRVAKLPASLPAGTEMPVPEVVVRAGETRAAQR